MADYFQWEKERIERMRAQQQQEEHDYELKQMCAKMIEDALRQHDQEIQVNVQTTLNGKPVTMNGLIDDVKREVTKALQDAFRK